MDVQASLSKIMVSSKPEIQTIGDTKVLTFQVNDRGNDITCHMWGKYGERAGKYLAKGHEISALGRVVPDNNGKGTFNLDRILMPEKPWILRQLSYWGAMSLIKIEELWPFGRKTPEDPVPAEKSLVDMVLEWWEEERYDQVYLGAGEYDNLWTEEPDFVIEARKIKEEVTL